MLQGILMTADCRSILGECCTKHMSSQEQIRCMLQQYACKRDGGCSSAPTLKLQSTVGIVGDDVDQRQKDRYTIESLNGASLKG